MRDAGSGRSRSQRGAIKVVTSRPSAAVASTPKIRRAARFQLTIRRPASTPTMASGDASTTLCNNAKSSEGARSSGAAAGSRRVGPGASSSLSAPRKRSFANSGLTATTSAHSTKLIATNATAWASNSEGAAGCHHSAPITARLTAVAASPPASEVSQAAAATPA